MTREGTYRCAACGAMRDYLDMGWINQDPYCHPFDRGDETCYMIASRLPRSRRQPHPYLQ